MGDFRKKPKTQKSNETVTSSYREATSPSQKAEAKGKANTDLGSGAPIADTGGEPHSPQLLVLRPRRTSAKTPHVQIHKPRQLKVCRYPDVLAKSQVSSPFSERWVHSLIAPLKQPVSRKCFCFMAAAMANET